MMYFTRIIQVFLSLLLSYQVNSKQSLSLEFFFLVQRQSQRTIHFRNNLHFKITLLENQTKKSTKWKVLNPKWIANNPVCVFFFILFLFVNWKYAASDLENLHQRKSLLEKQVQAAAQEQQHLLNQLIRSSVHQVENSAKQLQIAQVLQTIAANVLASKGLNDVNILQFRWKHIARLNRQSLSGCRSN